jgi:oligopeptide transport system ATP-binding protein
LILSVSDLEVAFHTRNGVARAVDGVSFQLEKGKTIGIVGESGSGKSVSCYALLGLIPQPPGRIGGGRAVFQGQDLLSLSEKELRKVRGNKISMIFQDPMTCLNPWLKIGSQLIEPLQEHHGLSKSAAWAKAIEAMEQVGIVDPERRIQGYPHEFSGGMRQRVMIAMALITRPELLLADEPTTALDVTVQKQVLELMQARQRELGTGMVFITHDLQVVSNLCDYVCVMYAGRFVEAAPAQELFRNPRHSYTRALLNSIPSQQKPGERLRAIPGNPPDLTKLTGGCSFSARQSPERRAKCLTSRPAWVELSPGHFAQQCPGCVDGL